MSDEVNKHFEAIMNFINTPNRYDCPYFVIDRIENYITEILNEEANEND